MNRDLPREQTTAAPAPPRWSPATMLLHWVSAVLVITLLALGWFMVHADLSAASKFDLYQLHKSLGFVVLGLLALRLAARAAQAAPPPPATMPRWEIRAAAATHVALYLLMLAATLSGWLLVSSAVIAIPTRFFDLFVIPNIAQPDAVLFARMTLLHYIVSRLLMGLVALHIAAALKHHFIDRDAILRRMLPEKSVNR